MGPNMEKPEICEGGYVWRWWAWGPREGVAHVEPSWDCCPLIGLFPSLPTTSNWMAASWVTEVAMVGLGGLAWGAEFSVP